MRRAARVDDNQAEIVSVLRDVGCKVKSLAMVGEGTPDLLVGYAGVLYLLEVKDGEKPPSKRKLTPDQETFFDEWRGYPIFVVNSTASALLAIGVGAAWRGDT